MPTGYTAKLYEGEPQSPRDFILTCARAFGATIHQRDEATDSPPRPREADTSYHDEALEKARRSMHEASTWTDAQADQRAREENAAALLKWREAETVRIARSERYQAMIAEVVAWEPPTADHESLKDFMVEQLRQSIDFDCSPWDPPALLTGAEARAQTIERAERDLAYHEKARREEIERTEKANAWIEALYESLPADARVPA